MVAGNVTTPRRVRVTLAFMRADWQKGCKAGSSERCRATHAHPAAAPTESQARRGVRFALHHLRDQAPIAGTGAEVWVNLNPKAYQDLAQRYLTGFGEV